MSLHRLFDRLQQRRSLVRRLVLRQPLLRRTTIGRRLARSSAALWAELPLPVPASVPPPGLPFGLPELGVPPLESIAELLPEPLPEVATPEPSLDQPSVRNAAAPPMARPAQTPATDSGTTPPATSQHAPLPATPQRALVQPRSTTTPQVAPRETAAEAPTSPLAIEPMGAEVTPETTIPAAMPETVPAPSASAAATAQPPADAPQSAPPVSAQRSAPMATPTDSPIPPVRPRRRGSVIELPVAPEVAASIAAAAGDRPQDMARSTPPASAQPPVVPERTELSAPAAPPAATPEAVDDASSAPPMPATMPPATTRTADHVPGEPAGAPPAPPRTPQEWARQLFGATNPPSASGPAATVHPPGIARPTGPLTAPVMPTHAEVPAVSPAQPALSPEAPVGVEQIRPPLTPSGQPVPETPALEQPGRADQIVETGRLEGQASTVEQPVEQTRAPAAEQAETPVAAATSPAPEAPMPAAPSSADSSVSGVMAETVEPAPSVPSRPPQTTPRRGRVIEEASGAQRPAMPPTPRPAEPAPRAWGSRPPGAGPAIPEGPRASDELFVEPTERDSREWMRLLFEATNPQRPRAQAQPPAVQPAPPAGSGVMPPAAPSGQPSAPSGTSRSARRRASVVQTPAGTGIQPTGQPPAGMPPPSAPTIPPMPSPLRESTRRFLRPIVGIEPADVRIYRGSEAGDVTRQLGVEGVSLGETIALGPGHEDESRPETLGLLAHELTHTARQRDPQYVPPVAAEATPAAAGEEQVARAAERRTLAAARRFVAARATPAAPTPIAPLTTEPPMSADRERWGDLPAPWEPLPSWLNPEPAVAPSESAAPPVNSVTPVRPGLPSAPSAVPTFAPVSAAAPAVAAPAAAPAAHFAEGDRGIAENEQPAGTQAEQQESPATDLDALARQVYDKLKQRLAAERRRLG